MTARWNHNTHYWPVVLAAVDPASAHVLDVGCGDGALARELAARGARVTAIDVDEPSLDVARREGGGVDYICADFLAHDFGAASYDAVVSVAALHHMDMQAGLRRMSELVRPGGSLVVIGLARSTPADLPRDAVAAVAHRWLVARRGHWEQTAPTVWPPPQTYAEARRIALAVLPGARFRRRLLWRYTITWTKPS